MSSYAIAGIAGAVIVAGLLAWLLTRGNSTAKGLQQFNQSTTNANATVSSVPAGTGLNVDGYNLLNPSAPIERTLTVGQADLNSTLKPYTSGDNPAAASIILYDGSGNNSDRMVRIAPMGTDSSGNETVQVVSVQKGQRLEFTSNQTPSASYISLFHADDSPAAAGINAVNSERDYLNLGQSDPSWAVTMMGLATSANKNVTAN
jgi:hypothetical protein